MRKWWMVCHPFPSIHDTLPPGILPGGKVNLWHCIALSMRSEGLKAEHKALGHPTSRNERKVGLDIQFHTACQNASNIPAPHPDGSGGLRFGSWGETVSKTDTVWLPRPVKTCVLVIKLKHYKTTALCHFSYMYCKSISHLRWLDHLVLSYNNNAQANIIGCWCPQPWEERLRIGGQTWGRPRDLKLPGILKSWRWKQELWGNWNICNCYFHVKPKLILWL